MEILFLRFLGNPTVVWVLTTRLVSAILSLFLPWQRRQDPLPSDRSMVKFIFLISYADDGKQLTWMSFNTTQLAATIADRYPGAKVLGCEFINNPAGAHEWKRKLRILPEGRAVSAGKASSSTDERELLVAKALELENSIDYSIVVGNGAHMRRDSLVWEHYHPTSRLCFRSTNAKLDDDPQNPMIAQRYWQTWVFANLVGEIFYRLLGVGYFANKNLSQPVS